MPSHGRPGRRLLDRQRAAAERLRREVLAAGGSPDSGYFRDLRSQSRAHPIEVPLREIKEASEAADVLYVGDFHADAACQRFAADLVAHLGVRRGRLVLGIEFVYARQQALLDRRQKRLLPDADFLRRIHYREEWGYPWEGFRDLLDSARSLGVPVKALDVTTRGGTTNLARRDEHAARRISSLLAEDPTLRLLVLFGESHVSPAHIPRRVRRHLARRGIERREVTILQDPDPVYWTLAARGEVSARAVRLGPTTFAVLHTPPLAKYEAYRQVLERWRGDLPPEDEVDLTPAVHHLLHVLLEWLGVHKTRLKIRHEGGWEEDLADCFPEVYSGPEAAGLLAPILEEHGRTPEEVADAHVLLTERHALYEPRSNTLFLGRYLPGPAAAEGARFLRAALSGRLFAPDEATDADPAARTYGAVYNEALAYLGSRLVDPSSHLEVEGAGGEVPEESRAGSLAERVRWLEEHRRFEESGRASPPSCLLDNLRGPRSLRRALARDLGQRLGRRLYDRVRRGELGSRKLLSLFRARFGLSRAPSIVLDLLRG